MGHSSIAVTMDVYGHLFPSDAEDLTDKLDAMFRESQTDKRRTKPSLVVVDGGVRSGKTQAPQGIPAAPSGGLEPPTPGLGNRCSIP